MGRRALGAILAGRFEAQSKGNHHLRGQMLASGSTTTSPNTVEVPIMWKAGHSLLKAKMKETHALLAGEMSGHMFFKERYLGYDDAIYAFPSPAGNIGEPSSHCPLCFRICPRVYRRRKSESIARTIRNLSSQRKPRNISANATISSTWTASASNFPRVGADPGVEYSACSCFASRLNPLKS